MGYTIAIAQRLAKLQDTKQLLAQVEAAQKKEATLKSRLGPWLDESLPGLTQHTGKVSKLATYITEHQVSQRRTSHKAVGGTSEAGSHAEHG